MGEIVVPIELENDGDRTLFEEGYRREEDIRRVAVDAIADTGAAMLTLPADVVERLGLQQAATVTATLADGSRNELPVVGRVTIRLAGREMLTEAVVLPSGVEPLIGQIVMERLNLIADCANRTLTPDPRSPERPLLRV